MWTVDASGGECASRFSVGDRHQLNARRVPDSALETEPRHLRAAYQGQVGPYLPGTA